MKKEDKKMKKEVKLESWKGVSKNAVIKITITLTAITTNATLAPYNDFVFMFLF